MRVHRITSAPGAGGLTVCPDGYAGFRGGVADGEQLHRWLSRIAAVSGPVTHPAR